MITYIMVLEKCKTKEEVEEYIKIMIRNMDNKQLKDLKRIILYLYDNISNEIIKLIEESESEEKMSTIRERIAKQIRNEKEQERKIGIEKGMNIGIAYQIKKTVKRMIKMDLEDNFIEETTGATKEEIQKIREEMA